MDELTRNPGRIAVLPGYIAQKIAAGEVIERPQSVVRELVDNAIDAQCSDVQIWLKNGGNDEILLQDNGSGMCRADIALCWLPHATSKISSEADLYRISTLGFRGEALSAISSVSQCSILSSTGTESSILVVHGGELQKLESSPAQQGTRLSIRNLFYNLPARKEFLKRSATEFTLCQTTVQEKSLCFPAVQFRLWHDGEPRLILPALAQTNDYKDRIFQIYAQDIGSTSFLHEIAGTTEKAKITIVLCTCERFRNDRKLIQIFINKRKIQDFGLQQAVEYGFTGFLPGGRFPLAWVYLDIDPDRIDVNIHPAKREARLKDFAILHHRIVELIQHFLKSHEQQRYIVAPAALQESAYLPYDKLDVVRTTERLAYTPSNTMSAGLAMQALPQASTTVAQATPAFGTIANSNATIEFKYHGLVFGCYLLAEKTNELYMIDMHAAHERILFDGYLQQTARQPLLLPQKLQPEELGKLWLQRESVKLGQYGLDIQSENDETWTIHAVPIWLTRNEASIASFLASPHGSAFEVFREAAAQIACRQAIKDGDAISHQQAIDLITRTFALPDPHCPHGRPVWYSLSHAELKTLIGRDLGHSAT